MADERFVVDGETVLDTETELVWTLTAAPAFTGLPWAEALEYVASMNERGDYGFNDWRLPNRRELNSLTDYGKLQPSLPEDHPFSDVWKGWYWTSTTYAGFTNYAWRLQLSGGRMFYGRKTEDSMVWPVRGTSTILPATGQTRCYDTVGAEIPCDGTGQDGAIRAGVAWPEPRFEVNDGEVTDALTGLIWNKSADLTGSMVSWEEAVNAIKEMADKTGKPWRLPTIRELESLTDCSCARPALCGDQPFTDIPEACWSATTSGFDPEWAFCLYWEKGAVGVGYKINRDFYVWPVRDAE